MSELEVFATATALHDAVAERVVDAACAAIRARGRFVVALSGGRTPLPIYKRLSVRTDIDWRHVFVTWVDERCVPPESAASNYRNARLALLDHIPMPHENAARIEGERAALASADAYEVTLRRLLVQNGRLDLALLGLGVDGHVASLFPGHQALRETRRWALPVHVPADPPWRVTMTLPLLSAARCVFLLAAGSEKQSAFRRCREGEDLPATRVRPLNGTLEWFVDAAAAGEGSQGALDVQGDVPSTSELSTRS